jgi:hypothetical protein
MVLMVGVATDGQLAQWHLLHHTVNERDGWPGAFLPSEIFVMVKHSFILQGLHPVRRTLPPFQLRRVS